MVILLAGIAGAAVSLASPWQVNEWQYWAFVFPCCVGVGWVVGNLFG